MISIVTPTFNSQKTLANTLESLVRQEYKNFEVIVIDNLSTDETLKIAQSFSTQLNLKIVSEKDRGIADAFNKGITLAQGEVVAILNSDDFYIGADVLGRVVDEFKKTNADIVHGNMIFKDDLHGTNLRRPLLCSPKKAFPFNHPAFFVKKEIYQRFGLFSLDFKYAMDFEWICRLYDDNNGWKIGLICIDGAPLVQMNAGGASYNHELSSIGDVVRALKLHQLYDLEAVYYQLSRRLRIYLKQLLTCIGLSTLVKIWRRFKWKRI
jgi:glycosyltransferase involved in cell wall biosynthesis